LLVFGNRRVTTDKMTETISWRITKRDYALLMKLADAKGATITSLMREALHILFAHHGMLPEESTRILLGQFIHKANEAFATSEA